MQLAARATVFLALLGVLAVFLPVGQIDVAGGWGRAATSRSFYQIGRSTGAIRELIAEYQASTAKKIGARALDKIAPRLRGKAGSAASDVQDAMSTLDELRDEDVKLVGTIVSTVMWSLIGLNLAVVILLYGVNAATSRLRVAAAVLAAFLVGVLSVALYLVLDRVVVEANAEIGAPVFLLRFGAYLIPLAGAGMFLAAIAMVVGYVRTRGQMAAMARASHAR